VSTLAVDDLSALEVALDAVPVGDWIEVITAGETFRLRCVAAGSFYLPGDLTIRSGDICDGKPSSVKVLTDFEKRLAEASYGTLDLTTLSAEAKDFLRESGLI
jgi:hypothetical protein